MKLLDTNQATTALNRIRVAAGRRGDVTVAATDVAAVVRLVTVLESWRCQAVAEAEHLRSERDRLTVNVRKVATDLAAAGHQQASATLLAALALDPHGGPTAA